MFDEVKRLGLELFPPDINKSDLVFAARVVDNREVVMFGMGAIKGAGDVAINSILNAREEGNFANLSDFVSRIDASKVNKRVIESLAKAGVFDSFGYSRNALLSQIEKNRCAQHYAQSIINNEQMDEFFDDTCSFMSPLF